MDPHPATITSLRSNTRTPIGRTPLVRLRRIAPPGSQLWVKCEWMNPAGSVKDRAAFRMIVDVETRGLLGPGKSLLDSTSGNTGIALAQIAAARGHALTLCVPANMAESRRQLFKAIGVELILTYALEGADGARACAAELARENPSRYVYLDQYSNPMNWRSHYEGTAQEIWEQTGGGLTHFVAILGTGGTFTGTARRLAELNPRIERIVVQPDAAYHGIEGAKHYDSTEVPEIFDPSLVTGKIEISTEVATQMTARLAREEGIPSGISGGAAVAAALQVAARTEGRHVVTVIPDHLLRAILESGAL